MRRDEAIRAIYNILKEKMNIATLSLFGESARLNEDLYLDSVMVLQLILHLELDLGIDIPDDVLRPNDFHTVASLVGFLERLQNEKEMEEAHD
ncbi:MULTISPECIES: petrobactin biosynthesis protein AsbD [Anoxybacillus]|uniref:Acyl carrier protein n=1 Tax=Anoxybacillus ayderensis TaxID=265546 RepID=A0A0D0G7V6_9BACL|nr:MULTISPECIES: petrobactin biosynthesis protein AsbD [Anoxybacillus]KIP21465.1 acyl carrier protein [Anoxybacillus ayderensis]NNU97019.1 petrobactin biosynthesis protein AsbD [Anoxybacillus sp. EFIL]